MVQIRWKALKHTKDILISNLRGFLANPNNYSGLLPPQFEENHYVDTIIFDTEPEEVRSFPVIIISGVSGDMITSGLGDMAMEMHNGITNELQSYRYGGMYEFNITMEIGTKSTLDREVLSDLVSHALRFSIRRKMEAEGILVKSMKYGGESVVQYDSNHIYVTTVNLTTWSEWYDDITLLPVEDVTINQK